MTNARQRGKGVALACRIRLPLNKCMNKLSRIWNEGRGVCENRGDGEDGILADVCVAVLKARSC